MKINLPVAVPVSAAVLLLAGCGGGSDSTGAAAASPSSSDSASVAATPTDSETSAAGSSSGANRPKGFTVAVDRPNGYQVALPSGFMRISKKSDLEKVMKAGKNLLSEKGLVDQLDNKTLKMLSVNSATGDAINVVVTGAGGVTSDQLPQMRDVLKQQAQQLGGTGIHIKTAALGTEPALRTDYVVKIQGKRLNLLQYIAVHGDSVYTLTFTEPVKIPATTENKTVESWRFL